MTGNYVLIYCRGCHKWLQERYFSRDLVNVIPPYQTENVQYSHKRGFCIRCEDRAKRKKLRKLTKLEKLELAELEHKLSYLLNTRENDDIRLEWQARRQEIMSGNYVT